MTIEKTTRDEMDYEFVLILSGISAITDEVADALYEAGCDDALLALQCGRVTLDFTRRAGSMREAILGAIRDVRRNTLGVDVVGLDTCNTVSQAEIARKMGVTRQAVGLWIAEKRGPGGFPPPSCHLTDGHPLWAWSEVAFWASRNGLMSEAQLQAARDVELVNLAFQYRRMHRDDPASFDSVLSLVVGFDSPRPVGSDA